MPDGIFFQNQNKVFDKLLKDIKGLRDNLIDELDAEMGASIQDMVTDAKKYAIKSAPTGRLANSITSLKDGSSKLSYHLKAEVRYAAYVEFGTGPLAAQYTANLDEDWKEYAWEFKEEIDGHTPAKPFMYPSVQKNFPIMIKNMTKIIENERR
jgi:hypothetical protein